MLMTEPCLTLESPSSPATRSIPATRSSLPTPRPHRRAGGVAVALSEPSPPEFFNQP